MRQKIMRQEIIRHDLSNNSFISEDEQKKQNAPYYGEFFAIKEFDDGWRENISEKLINFCDGIKNESIHVEVCNERENINGKIKVILTLENLGEESEEQILHLTTKLQQDFLMTPIVQNTNFPLENSDSIPCIIEEPDKQSKKYKRYILQKEIAKTLHLENEIERLDYIIDFLGEVIIGDQAMTLLSIAGIRDQHLKSIEELNQSIEGIIQKFYLEKAISPFGIEHKLILGNVKASAILDINDDQNYDEGDRIRGWLTRIEDIVDKNTKTAIDIEKKYQIQIGNLSSKLDQLVKNYGIDIHNTKGILTDLETDESGNLIKAKIAGKIDSDVYVFDNYLHGYELEGIDLPITNLKKIDSKDGYLSKFAITLSSGKKAIYFIHQGEYVKLDIEGINEFDGYQDLKNNSDFLIQSGKIKVADKWCLFYLNEGGYDFFKVDGEKDYNWFIDIEYENNIPTSGILKVSDEERKYFFNDGEKNTFLNIQGEDIFTSIKIQTYDGNEPITGIVEKQDGLYYQFHKVNGKNQYLSLDGQSGFEKEIRINKLDESGKILSGIVHNNEGQSFFYLEDGEYQILSIDGKESFKSFDIRELNEDGKIVKGHGKVSGGKEKYIYLDEGKHKVLSVNGEEDFEGFINLECNNKGVPAYGEVDVGFRRVSYIYQKNNAYKFVDIEGNSVFRSVYKYEYNDEKIITLGQVEHTNKLMSLFELKNGEHKYISIGGKKHFNSIRSSYNKSNNITMNNFKIRNEDDLYSYACKVGSGYELISIENKSEFKDISVNFCKNDDTNNVQSGVVTNENNIKRYFYKEDGKFVYLKIKGKRNFAAFEDMKFENNKLISGTVYQRNSEGKLADGKKFLLENGKHQYSDRIRLTKLLNLKQFSNKENK